MWRAAFMLVVISACTTKAPEAPVCTPAVVAPTDVTGQLGFSSRVVVRLENPGPRPLGVTGLELGPSDAFRRVFDSPFAEVPAGTCEAPGVFEVELDVTPTSREPVSAVLRGVLGGTPFEAVVTGRGTGAQLGPIPSVHFGRVLLGRVARRSVRLENLGPAGSVLQVDPIGDQSELCVGAFTLQACSPTLATVEREGLLNLELRALTPGLRSWEVTLRSSEYGQPEQSLRVTADVFDETGCSLEFDPRLLTLEVDDTTVERRTVFLENKGTGACFVAGVSASDARVVVDGPRGGWPGVLAPGASVPLRLTIRATESLEPARLLAESASTSANLELRFLDRRVRDCLVVSPAVFDAGLNTVGCPSDDVSVRVWNRCAGPVGLSTYASPPAFLADTPRSPLAPGEEQFLSLTLRPQPGVVGHVTSSVLLTANFVPIEVPVVGEWQPNVEMVARYVVEPLPAGDIVVVVDHTPGFRQRHGASVRARLEHDWSQVRRYRGRFFVTSTGAVDGGPGGELQETDAGVPWASSRDSTVADYLSLYDSLPRGGPSRPACLEAASRAVAFASARGFLRAGAPRGIVCITDDVDHSPQQPALQRQLLDASRDAGVRLTYVVVGPERSTCPATALDDGRHAANTSALGGFRLDLCDQWTLFPFDLGAGPSRRSFFLPHVVRAGTLSVTVDGTRVNEFDAQGARVWSFDPNLNAVVLTAEPPDDAHWQVEVRYVRSCP